MRFKDSGYTDFQTCYFNQLQIKNLLANKFLDYIKLDSQYKI